MKSSRVILSDAGCLSSSSLYVPWSCPRHASFTPRQGWQQFCTDWHSSLADGMRVLRVFSASTPVLESSVSWEALHLETAYHSVGRITNNKVATNFILSAMYLCSLLNVRPLSMSFSWGLSDLCRGRSILKTFLPLPSKSSCQ